MKPKIIVLGIVLTGIVAACGVNSSKKPQKPPFDVHTFDGYYYETYHYDTGHGPGQYTNYLNLHYPFLEVCANYFGQSTKFTAEIDYVEDVNYDTLKNFSTDPSLYVYFNALNINGKNVRHKGITFAVSDSVYGVSINVVEIKNDERLGTMGLLTREAAKDTLTCGDVPYSEDLR